MWHARLWIHCHLERKEHIGMNRNNVQTKNNRFKLKDAGQDCHGKSTAYSRRELLKRGGALAGATLM